MRLPFLVLTPACLLPAFAYVNGQRDQFDYVLAAMILIAALCAHISVNMFNEYLDFTSGLDAMTVRTAFSGGSGALIAHPEVAGRVLAIAWLNLCLTLLAGAYFITKVGLAIMPVGLVGVITILTYTQWINRSPLLCLLAPGLAFGPLMSFGTFYVMTGDYQINALLISLPAFFMVNNLLLLNQLPDIKADKMSGRKHLMISYGIDTGLKVYLLFLLLAAVTLLVAISTGALPYLSLLAILPICLGVFAHNLISRKLDLQQDLSPALALNVIVCILTPVFIAIGIYVR